MVAPVFHNQELPALAVKETDPPVQKVVAEPAVMIEIGKLFTVTVVVAEVNEQPCSLVTVTLKFPPVVTTILSVVAPVFHNQELPALAVKETDPPVQKVVAEPGVMVAIGKLFTVTEVDKELAEQPFALVITTL